MLQKAPGCYDSLIMTTLKYAICTAIGFLSVKRLNYKQLNCKADFKLSSEWRIYYIVMISLSMQSKQPH